MDLRFSNHSHLFVVCLSDHLSSFHIFKSSPEHWSVSFKLITVFLEILVDTFFPPSQWVPSYLINTTYLSFFKNGRKFQLL